MGWSLLAAGDDVNDNGDAGDDDDDDDDSSSRVRRTPCGRWLPLEVAMVDMIFMASLILPLTRYHLGDSEMKGRTKRTKMREGKEEAK